MEARSSVEFVDTSSLDDLLNRIKNSLKVSDQDIKIVRDINLLLKQPTPTVQSGIESRVSTIDSMRVELSDLIYKIENSRAEQDYKYHLVYDKEYTLLVKAERPSHAAIDAEIHAKSKELSDQRLLINNYDIFKSLLLGYLRSLDSSRDTCIKKWGFA